VTCQISPLQKGGGKPGKLAKETYDMSKEPFTIDLDSAGALQKVKRAL